MQLTQAQYDALVSFTYNVGPGLGADPVIHLINNGQNTAAAMRMKQHYITARIKLLNGQISHTKPRGLVLRRAEEAAPFETALQK